ncbi:cold-shock protein [Legionella pneumophila]|uniref:cold-shock protein n=1 Tax=Legionella pneumophila TaxID=446 RepID=UPI001A183646|nr:cold shock domain-containing protein [Legionella pneumophila]HAT1860717.1 cold shock domain-containing protein [Legionella pneumophila]HAU2155524.1 cold shock domain-containing protein [Legionella pneumophila]
MGATPGNGCRLTRPSNGKDYFVHFSAIQSSGFKNLPEGANILFKAGKGQKGPQAEEVEIIK